MTDEYLAYLVRFQRDNGDEHWRASLEDANTGEEIRFANEYEILSYLLKRLAQNRTSSAPDPSP